MKFAHLADCHIGGWRDERLKDLNLTAFVTSIDKCIEKKVDFILISGDLFNTSIPGIDKLKECVKCLRKLRRQQIAVYIIAGSHDFSPSGKTMLDVLEEAGLVKNVVSGEVVEDKLKLKFTIDAKTGAKITGMLGKKGMLEKSYYENLEVSNLEQEEGFKIFMFHTAITELKTKEMENMDSAPISLLPKGFDYYAGGHVHIVNKFHFDDYNHVVYPGPTFPNNFGELEKLKKVGFYLYEDGLISYEPISVCNVFCIKKDCTEKSPEEIEAELRREVLEKTFDNTIVLIRLKGTLKTGRPSDVNLNEIIKLLYDKSALFVMKNTNALESKEFEEVKVQESSVEKVEAKLIKEHLGQNKDLGLDVEKEEDLTKELIQALSEEKQEGEKVYEFESRVKKNARSVIAKEIFQN
ncbi:exonuclease SbcCD subunit D [Candidatus Woesearchaeota archaeon]|nr:exonuclease SbcCD subunit D [Candidatus Woesearchaeota archaeon]